MHCFIAKRVVRIDPPFLASIALVLMLTFASSRLGGNGGAGFEINYPALFAHLGYLNAIIGLDWLTPVYWTLAIEAQYYLLMAFLFPLFTNRFIKTDWQRSLVCLGLAMGCYLAPHNTQLIFYWLPLFGIGILCFQRNSIGCDDRVFWISYAAILVVAYSAIPWPQATTGALTGLIIVYAKFFEKILMKGPLVWLGTISYSLYLVHAPLGNRLINFALRLEVTGIWHFFVVVFAIISTIVFAYGFYRIFEKPFQTISSKIDY